MSTELIRQGLASFSTTWANLGGIVTKLQLLVLLDVIHAAAGLWPDEVAVGLLQRLWCKVGHRAELFVTVTIIGEHAKHWSVGPMVFTWALADVSRYQLYFLRSIGRQPPSWLSWLRYSDFLIQYPLNVLAEGFFVYSVLPHLMEAADWWMSYAPIAVAFQVYEWVIFIPAYRTLWCIRKRRLAKLYEHHSTSTKIGDGCALSMPDRHCMQRFTYLGEANNAPTA